MITSFYHAIFSTPLFNLLVVLYKTVSFEDLGVAIVLLTLIIRLVLYPLFYKSFKNQTMQQKLQPEIAAINARHKHDKTEQVRATMELYKKHKFNPFSSIIFILIQLPILIAVYQLFATGLSTASFGQLYSFVSAPEHINNMFLSLIDLTKPSWIVVLLAVAAQYGQSLLSLPKKKAGEQKNPQQKASQFMVYLAPLMTLLILPRLPAAIGIYWLVSSVFSVFQQYAINRAVYGKPEEKTGAVS